MSFGTTTILIAYLSPSNVAARWNVGGVLEITKTDLVNDKPAVALASLD